MSFKWPNKDPQETLDYSIDWSRFLGTDTITGITWFISGASGVDTQITAPGQTVEGLTAVNYTSATMTTTILLGAGTTNATYRVTCRITTSSGLVSERTVRISIKDL
jgi:nitrous oxidase accessory protein NosD